MLATKGNKNHLHAASLWNRGPRNEFRAGTLLIDCCKNTARCRALAASGSSPIWKLARNGVLGRNQADSVRMTRHPSIGAD